MSENPTLSYKILKEDIFEGEKKVKWNFKCLSKNLFKKHPFLKNKRRRKKTIKILVKYLIKDIAEIILNY